MSKEPSRAAILTGHLTRAFPLASVYSIARSVDRLQRLAGVLHAIAIRECNGYRDDEDQAKDERKEELTREKVMDVIRSEFPEVDVKFGGDPRGCVLKIKIPGQHGDDFGGEGWFGVYK